MFVDALKLRNRYGLLSEDVHPTSGALWGNFPQTYSMAGLILTAMKLSTQLGGPLLARLVVVSNRVAVPDEGSVRAGGLEVAVKAALKRMEGTWFGWSGDIAPRSKAKTTHDQARQCHLRRHRSDRGGPQGILQRLCQPRVVADPALSARSRRILSPRSQSDTCGSTTHFARQLHELIKPDDLIWVHDYHLMPLAKALRELGHKNRIGFFLHIPCPPPEILTALPHHERLLPTLCDYDLVGFQTGDDAFNFSRYLTRECGLHSRDFNFPFGERSMRIDAFPVGIETAALRAPRAAQRELELRAAGARKPVRARPDHRRRPARLHQGAASADAMPSSASWRRSRTGAAR